MPDIPHDTLADRVETYAGWVRDLRLSTKAVLPEIDPEDPLFPLGQELRLLADAMERRERETGRLFDLVQHALRGVMLDDVLNDIYHRFAGIIPYDRISCAFLSDDGQYLTAYWAASNLPGKQVQPGYTQPIAGSSLLDVIASGQPRIINDLAAYLESKPHSDGTRRVVAEGGRSSLTCPLFVDDKPIGFLFFTSEKPNTYHDSHQSVFRQIAGQISLVLHRSRTHAELVRNNSYLLQKTTELEHLYQLIMR
jgi:GAF domain-containing protein